MAKTKIRIDFDFKVGSRKVTIGRTEGKEDEVWVRVDQRQKTPRKSKKIGVRKSQSAVRPSQGDRIAKKQKATDRSRSHDNDIDHDNGTSKRPYIVESSQSPPQKYASDQESENHDGRISVHHSSTESPLKSEAIFAKDKSRAAAISRQDSTQEFDGHHSGKNKLDRKLEQVFEELQDETARPYSDFIAKIDKFIYGITDSDADSDADSDIVPSETDSL